jgi:hypothetical protein
VVSSTELEGVGGVTVSPPSDPPPLQEVKAKEIKAQARNVRIEWLITVMGNSWNLDRVGTYPVRVSHQEDSKPSADLRLSWSRDATPQMEKDVDKWLGRATDR